MQNIFELSGEQKVLGEKVENVGCFTLSLARPLPDRRVVCLVVLEKSVKQKKNISLKC